MQSPFENLCLPDGARKAVKDGAPARIRLAQTREYQITHQIIRDELSTLDVALGCPAWPRALAQVFAQGIAAADARHTQASAEEPRLSTLSSRRSTKQHHNAAGTLRCGAATISNQTVPGTRATTFGASSSRARDRRRQPPHLMACT
jgi:hypothetical protein